MELDVDDKIASFDDNANKSADFFRIFLILSADFCRRFLKTMSLNYRQIVLCAISETGENWNKKVPTVAGGDLIGVE